MITRAEFNKLQKLAKLGFSDEEIPLIMDKLNKVMEMIDEIKDVDCTGVEPLRSVCDMDLRTRPDEVTEGNIKDRLFSNIPGKGSEFAREIKCFVVPKVVE
jgi:aspartyl-tRNA(Asn)/glutamyl-tRNA(Gln) amidotransferase subunit C